MDIDQAEKINSEVVRAGLNHVFGTDAPLPDYSLTEMIEARNLLKNLNDAEPDGTGKKSLHVLAADRLIAGIYALKNYSHCVGEPIAVSNGLGIVVLPVKKTTEVEG
jgi:hypothetical protein